MSSSNPEVLQAFRDESLEYIDAIEKDLLGLEGSSEPSDEVINKIFRGFHTIKGGSGFLNLNNLRLLAHSLENLFDKIRNKKLKCSTEILNVLLAGCDLARGILGSLEDSNSEDIKTQVEAVESNITTLISEGETKLTEKVSSGEDDSWKSDLIRQFEADLEKNANVENTPTETEVVKAEPVQEVKVPIVEAQVVKPESKPAELQNKGQIKKEVQPAAGKPEGSVRVNLKILDTLMTHAGELVLTRNALVQSLVVQDMNDIERATQRVDIITSELQKVIMSTRMQSIGMIFGKFQRSIRDLANTLKKEIKLVLEGEDVELDKTIIETIGDPLTHLVRNSVDHGIETPEERLQNGKLRQGLLRISAFHKAGQVVIEIEDDGAGINIARIREKALKIGMNTKEQLDSMSEKELINFIFKPGFSTAKEVTEVSGRGVGMDVVLSNLTKIGGTVDVDSQLGKGTLTRIKLPLTLAIIPSLLVSVENERYAIPQINLRELVRIPARDVKKVIKRIGTFDVLKLRGELLPIYRLRDILGIDDPTYIEPETKEALLEKRVNVPDRRSADLATSIEFLEKRSGNDRRYHAQSAYNIVVVTVGDFHYGLIVDTLLDSSEIVVKPLGTHLHDCKIYAAATILGDGQVALILDVIGISQRVGLSSQASSEKNLVVKEKKTLGVGENIHPVVIIENHQGEYFGIPLELVVRIEKIKASEIEDKASRKTIKYRGGSLLLFSIEKVANVKPRNESKHAFIIVFKVHGKEVGLLSSQLVDILDINLNIDITAHKQTGIAGSTLVNNDTVLILDLFEIVDGSMPQLKSSQTINKIHGSRKYRALVVDDSPFFLEQVRSYVEQIGIQVVTAKDGKEAWEILEGEGDKIDIVLTDIEMPRMNGFELTKKIRAKECFKELPILAITSLAGDDQRQIGLAAGINCYMLKLNKELVVEKCMQYLEKRDDSKNVTCAV